MISTEYCHKTAPPTNWMKALVLRCPYPDCPLGIYLKITNNRPNTLLLESSDINSKRNLKSILLTHSALKIESRNGLIEFTALSDNGHNLLLSLKKRFEGYEISATDCQLSVYLGEIKLDLDEHEKLKILSTLDGLRVFLKEFSGSTDPDFPIFVCGIFGYDLAANFEPLPEVPTGFNDCPDYLCYVSETMLILDHEQLSAKVVSHLFPGAGEAPITHAIAKRNGDIRALCAGSTWPTTAGKPVLDAVSLSDSDEQFRATVEEMKSYILAGDIFQVVPSRSFLLPCPNPLGAYTALKQSNPSPYMFYLSSTDFTLFGASPESALKYTAATNQVEIYPIAGTRRRGTYADGSIDHDLDSRLELDLRLDAKELAEHLMLLDLARNDISRICVPGTRRVPELMKVDRYSHVMHLVSRVVGELRADLDALHAYQACMNMGTLVGAPKVRAAQLVRTVEQQRRGSYGGAIGYFNSNGDMDTCIVIRSAYVKDGIACIQAGAGVVFDSDPQAEADETRSKAQAVISAIQQGGG